MSKSEGNDESIERIPPVTESEREAIREEYHEVYSTRTGKIHPVDESGEAVCMQTQTHGVARWSGPKAIDTYPLGYAEMCRYCVAVWREGEGTDDLE